jgi:hypothetical protein
MARWRGPLVTDLGCIQERLRRWRALSSQGLGTRKGAAGAGAGVGARRLQQSENRLYNLPSEYSQHLLLMRHNGEKPPPEGIMQRQACKYSIARLAKAEYKTRLRNCHNFHDFRRLTKRRDRCAAAVSEQKF